MLKIALCDDDAVFLKELTGKIQELLRFEEKNAAIASFVNPTALTASVASGDRFDIFILDVEMPQIDGFKVAADLRKYQPNVALIFLTSHLQYAPEGYKVDALRFISKLNVDETLPEALQKALHTLEQQDQHSLLVQHYKNFSRVLYQNIIYVRKTARSVQIISMAEVRIGSIIDHSCSASYRLTTIARAESSCNKVLITPDDLH